MSEREDDPTRFATLANPQDHLVPRLDIVGLTLDERIAPLVPDLRIATGVVVAATTSDVVPGSDSQLQAGDLIHAINGTPVRTLAELRTALDALKVGDPAVVQIERDAELQYVALRLEK